MKTALSILLLTLATIAHADDAREHYQRGAALYDATRYEAALHEFEVAYAQQALPALVYNIARCLDRLDRYEEAAAAYARFLDADHSDDPQIGEARTRLAELHAMMTPTPAPNVVPTPTALTSPTPSTPSHRRYLTPGLLGGGTVVLGAVGASLLGNALWSYNGLSKACAPNCPTSSYAGLPARERAGEALLGIAGAAAVADVVLFVIAAKKRRK